MARSRRNIVIDTAATPNTPNAAADTGVTSKTTKHIRTMTLAAFCRQHKIFVESLAMYGDGVTKLCREHGVAPTIIEDQRFGSVRTYPEWILKKYFNIK